MEALSSKIIESEEAHFRSHPAPRLRGLAMKNPQQDPVPPELARFQTWLFQSLEDFQRLHLSFEQTQRPFKEAWGYLFFKSLFLNTAEFINTSRRARNPLKRRQILTLLAFLKQNNLMRHYLQGAKLSMLLETSDALSDAELFYLCQEESEGSVKAEGPLNSYHEQLAADILLAMRNALAQKKRLIRRKSVLKALGCFAALPFFGMLLQ